MLQTYFLNNNKNNIKNMIFYKTMPQSLMYFVHVFLRH